MKHDNRIIDKSTEPSDLVLDVKDLTVTYKSSSVFGTKSVYTAVNHVNLSIKQGEIMGLVGESGCGKSTLSRAILGMLDDAEITGEIIHYTRRPQMVFQDPFSSLNPSKTIGWIMEEPLRIFGKYSEKERKARVLDMIDGVGL